MPGGRRTIPKTLPYRSYSVYSISEDGVRSRVSSVAPASTLGSSDGDYLQSIVTMPKHIPIPDIPADSDLIFELIVFLYTLMALGLQYVNLYKTVWWLPHSHVKHAMNFYLIDVHLAGFVVIVLFRRLIWCIIKDILNSFLPSAIRQTVLQFGRMFVCFVLIMWLVWCTYHIVSQHPLMHMLYLYYPITIIYFILYGTSLSPFFELLPSPSKQLNKNRQNVDHNQNQQLRHVCYLTADAVRDEVELLKTNFNDRLKSVLFNSLLSAYYSAFIPCCFAQSVLLYDVSWVTQHLGFTWFSCFMLHLLHAYPPYYCDILHRSALHLGRWQKLESRNLHIPYLPWSESSLWHQGALVKQSKELFRAEGLINAAEPGNSSHSRFYVGQIVRNLNILLIKLIFFFKAFFINPSTCLCCLLGLQVTLVVVQLYLLFWSSEWNRIISIALLLFCNYYTLFKLCRDCLVLWKIYKAEQLIQEQMSN
uniref:Transmembrane protein 39A n=1 Tax=Strigamia maritima TaxID=126957 RepID=T1IUB5_STRMM